MSEAAVTQMDRTTLVAAANRLLTDAQVGWSVGRPGALAEFYRSNAEPVSIGDLAIATPRGAFALRLDGPVRMIAGESLGHSEDSWSQWIVFCLPANKAVLAAKSVIADIGPDRHAQRLEDRDSILFDLGIGGRFFQICVRAASGLVTDLLRSAAGKPLLDEASVVRALIELSPARVFESKLARVEVFQAIASPDGISPEGPHTHVLPALLQTRSDDEGNAPASWVDQAVAYPPHPLRDAFGHPKAFDRAQYDTFQKWLREFGDPVYLSVKNLVLDAVRAGTSPTSLQAGIDASRHEAIRIALRQLRCLDGDSDALARWCATYDI